VIGRIGVEVVDGLLGFFALAIFAAYAFGAGPLHH
jgi:hypothetical protein